METVSHVLYWCLSHEQESDPKEQLHYLWLLKFLEANNCICIQRSLVPYRLGAVLCVWLGSYRVRPAPLPYQGKLLVHKGASPWSLPAVVHRGGGPTPWHSWTLTGLCKTSLWLLSSLADFVDWGSLALQGLVSCCYIPPPSNYFSKCTVHVVDMVVL
jgi:hypothetical protein